MVISYSKLPFIAPQLPFTEKVLQFKTVYVITNTYYVGVGLKNKLKYDIILKGSNYNGSKDTWNLPELEKIE